tara:strand:- start:574 stop:984 length:411 start_codon:yes stop_codon:yes gene_type:complete
MRKVVLLIALSLSGTLFANEEFCELDLKEVESKSKEYADKATWLELKFPPALMGALYRVQLRYDHIEKMGGHEVFTELAFDRSSEGYWKFINLSRQHKPVLLVATYHLSKPTGGPCYSNLYVVIKNRKISSVTNGT